LIHDYPLRSRLALDTIEWLAKGVPREQGLPHQVNAAYLSEGLGLDAAGRGLLELIGLVIAAPALLGHFWIDCLRRFPSWGAYGGQHDRVQ
jgi:hypothetical protein